MVSFKREFGDRFSEIADGRKGSRSVRRVKVAARPQAAVAQFRRQRTFDDYDDLAGTPWDGVACLRY